AGIYASGLAHEADMDAFDQVIDVKVKALMRLTRLSLPHLLEASPAAVINVASVAGKMTFRGGGAYCASKHAVMGFTGSVFEDVREQGVKVCAICPGFVNTSMVAGRGLDMDKMIQPDDIADAVAFVASFPDTGCPTEIVIRPQRNPYT
ncbi:MAG: SDR family NAD(P)-dependent oxidoreductase, partial [Myxococcota bacterium]|nr:SDR family NAD(P)-dependent oxidoreductase [Myxococcota bacterium]